jgi:hypothetical protein
MNYKILSIVLVTVLVAGCANTAVTTIRDSNGYHVISKNASAVRETMYPVKKGMKVEMVTNLSSGEIGVLLVINGKKVFSRIFNKSERFNYTIPKTGACLVKIYLKNTCGRFDFLI